MYLHVLIFAGYETLFVNIRIIEFDLISGLGKPFSEKSVYCCGFVSWSAEVTGPMSGMWTHQCQI